MPVSNCPDKWVKDPWPKFDNLMVLYVMTCVALFAAMIILRMLTFEEHFSKNAETCITEHYYVFLPFMAIAIAFLFYVLAFTLFQTITVESKGTWDSEKTVVESKKVRLIFIFRNLWKHFRTS